MVQSDIKEGVLRIYISGRVDSSTSAETEKDIQKEIAANPHDKAVIDAEKLEYISSAGLRVILRLLRSEKHLSIENVSPEVYEILEMTGFTEMLPVIKAYRKFSVNGCEVIGQGANGKVYRIDDDTIIKVYFNSDALPDIHRERELAREAFILGIPTAIPYDVVKVGDSYGSVFELLNAKSFAKLIIAEPENIDKYVGLYVDLLKTIHSTSVKPGTMPRMKAVATDWAAFLKDYIPEDESKKLCALMEAVPESDKMLHGDYHIKNVMLQNGEVLLIDMDTLCTGNPVFEFASIYLAYCGFSENDPEEVKKFLGIDRKTSTYIWKKTLELYFGTDDEEFLRTVEEKAMIVGYTRLMRRTIRRNGFDTEKGRKMIETCKKHLSELLPKTDTLVF